MNKQLLLLTCDVAAAYLSINALPLEQVPELLRTAYRGLGQAAGVLAPEKVVVGTLKPAVPISRSVHEDYIVCLEDGIRRRSLKRYLAVKYGLTPEAYRRRWGLPPDYPMAAPSYSRRRTDMAHSAGLGRGQLRGPAKT
jgi:predicted transcriptional regulator